MLCQIICDAETGWVEVRARVVSEDGGKHGRLVRIIKPGDQFRGCTHQMLWELGTGTHELPFVSPPVPESTDAHAERMSTATDITVQKSNVGS